MTPARSTPARARAGFTLVEVVIALILLELGLVGCAQTLVLAQRHMAAAEGLHLATQRAAGVADSLLAAPAAAAGEAVEPWGTLRWAPGAGGLMLRAEDRSGRRVLEWWLPLAPPA